MTPILLALFLALPQKKAPQAAAFAGRWMTNFGPMELSAKQKAVSGTYGWSAESKLEGKLEDGRLEFEWSGPNGRGTGWFEPWKDGRTFTGQYTFGAEQKDFWGGYRLEKKRAEIAPGEVSDGQTELGLNYHLRVPQHFDPQQRYTAVALFHGSNYNSRDYVEGFPQNWPELAEHFILVGFDGEQLSPNSANGVRQFNSSYVNFSGEKSGEPWRYMQTPALVAGALKELSTELPIERWFVGGHSQGAFLTYAVALFYPELVAGAFPVAGGLLVQCEPSEFTDEKVRAAQRRIAIAIVHGEQDSVVEFSMSTYGRDALQDGGFPALRLFSDAKAGHPWAFLPVDDALRWLEEMTSGDADGLERFATRSLAEQHYRDALAALDRLAELAPARAEAVAALRAKVDAAALNELAHLTKLVAADKDDAWVDDFWRFRAEFALAPSAQGLMRAYADLRAKHQGPADELFRRARGLEDDQKKQELWRELVAKYHASRWYPLVKGWLR